MNASIIDLVLKTQNPLWTEKNLKLKILQKWDKRVKNIFKTKNTV